MVPDIPGGGKSSQSNDPSHDSDTGAGSLSVSSITFVCCEHSMNSIMQSGVPNTMPQTQPFSRLVRDIVEAKRPTPLDMTNVRPDPDARLTQQLLRNLTLDAPAITPPPPEEVLPNHDITYRPYPRYDIGYDPEHAPPTVTQADTKDPECGKPEEWFSEHTYADFLSPKNLPDNLFTLERADSPLLGIPVPIILDQAGHPIVSASGRQLRYFSFLPRYIPPNVRGFILEFWFRLDPRLEPSDITDRMQANSEKLPKGNAISMRRQRFRDVIRARSAQPGRVDPCRNEVEDLGRLTSAQVLLNTTIAIHDGEFWFPILTGDGLKIIGHIKSGLPLTYFLDQGPPTVPSVRQQVTIGLRHRLQIQAYAQGRGLEHDNWRDINPADQPTAWTNRGQRNNAQPPQPHGRHASKRPSTKRPATELDTVTHDEWIDKTYDQFKEINPERPKYAPRRPRLRPKPRTGPPMQGAIPASGLSKVAEPQPTPIRTASALDGVRDELIVTSHAAQKRKYEDIIDMTESDLKSDNGDVEQPGIHQENSDLRPGRRQTYRDSPSLELDQEPTGLIEHHLPGTMYGQAPSLTHRQAKGIRELPPGQGALHQQQAPRTSGGQHISDSDHQQQARGRAKHQRTHEEGHQQTIPRATHRYPVSETRLQEHDYRSNRIDDENPLPHYLRRKVYNTAPPPPHPTAGLSLAEIYRLPSNVLVSSGLFIPVARVAEHGPRPTLQPLHPETQSANNTRPWFFKGPVGVPWQAAAAHHSPLQLSMSRFDTVPTNGEGGPVQRRSVDRQAIGPRTHLTSSRLELGAFSPDMQSWNRHSRLLQQSSVGGSSLSSTNRASEIPRRLPISSGLPLPHSGASEPDPAAIRLNRAAAGAREFPQSVAVDSGVRSVGVEGEGMGPGVFNFDAQTLENDGERSSLAPNLHPSVSTPMSSVNTGDTSSVDLGAQPLVSFAVSTPDNEGSKSDLDSECNQQARLAAYISSRGSQYSGVEVSVAGSPLSTRTANELDQDVEMDEERGAVIEKGRRRSLRLAACKG